MTKTTLSRPRMEPVSSTAIRKLGYDRRRRELHVEFTGSAGTYIFGEVTDREFKAFRAANSKGRYFNSHMNRKPVLATPRFDLRA